MPEITINGEPVEVDEGELLFEVIRDQNIEVPHFCYHPELSLAGACRMCLVEIDGTIDISCTRRVEDGMDVVTDNEEVTDERRGILEFMLINHPLDCPVCDKGGECPLQDYTMGYGPAESRFHGNKRTFPKFDLGELLTQRQNRCILCYRCTRFYQEEGGRNDFRVIQRGNDAFVGKQPGGQLESELSGNMVDICPTGTIVTKPYLHKSRPWEQEPVDSITAFDPIQTPITADVRGNEITRIRPQEDPDFPKPWIDDRVRFVHEYNSMDDKRLELPVDETYFDRFDNMQEKFDQSAPGKTAGIISPDRTLEELYLFKKYFTEQLESDLIGTAPDVTGTQVDPTSFEDIMESDFILICGTNFRHAYPMLTPFLRTAARGGTQIAYLTYWGNELTIEPDVFMRESPDALSQRLERLSKSSPTDETDRAILEMVDEAENAVFISTEGYTVDDHFTQLGLGWDINWDYLRLSPGGNSKAAELIAPEFSETEEILQKASNGNVDSLMIYGLDLLREYPDRKLVRNALEEVDHVCLADYLENSAADTANSLIPITTQFEEPGVLINAEGRIRSRSRVTKPDERILDGWKMLSFLAYPNDEGEFKSRDDILAEISDSYNSLPELSSETLDGSTKWLSDFSSKTIKQCSLNQDATGKWTIFSEPTLFSGDRRAQIGPSIDGMIDESTVECHESDAESLGADRHTEISLRRNGSKLERPVNISKNLPEKCLFFPWNAPGDTNVDLFHGKNTLTDVEVNREEMTADGGDHE